MYSIQLQNRIKIVQVVNKKSNVYLIETSELKILVDTSGKGQLNNLTSTLKKYNIKKLDYLILTHTHYDHCQNAQFLKEEYGAQVVASVHSEHLAHKGFTPIPKGTLLATKFLSRLGNRWSILQHFKIFKVDIPMDKVYELTPGIKLISTPGHSADSLSVIINNEVALVGDTMFGIFSKSIFPPFADDVKEMISSWRKLMNTACHTFLPGHGKPIARERVEIALKKHQ